MNGAPQFMRPYRNKGAYFDIKETQRKRRATPQSTDYRGNRRTVLQNDGLSTLEVENYALFDIII